MVNLSVNRLQSPFQFIENFGNAANGSLSTMRLDGTTKKFGIKFYPTQAMTVTEVDVRLFRVGTLTPAPNWTLEIQTDSSGAG